MTFLSKCQAIICTAVLALTTTAISSHASLERVGPPGTSTAIGGFPIWYQDSTGLTLEFCNPTNQAEVSGGWCLLLPTDVKVTPEVFPTSFFDEHFYFAANSAPLQMNNGSKALLVLAQEAAFATGPATPGGQITFSRIRVSLGPVPMDGIYRIIHPYGEELIQGVQGQRIFFTDDVGINCTAGAFDCALHSRLGPFLLPSATPGGSEMPAVSATNQTPDTNPAHFGGGAPTPYPGTGKMYIADPARIGPVTGSPLPKFTDSLGQPHDHNVFRIEGPAGSGLGLDPITGATVDYIETTNFSLVGRVFTAAMPGIIKADSAYYTRNSAGQKVDVFVTATPTTQSRIPAQPKPAAIAPQLTFFDAPCAGTVDAFGTIHPPFSAPVSAIETQMFGADDMYWAQIQPAIIPSAVCIKNSSTRDAAGNVVPSFIQQTVTDAVTIGQALYDRGTGTLTVTASSSDVTTPPTLTMAYGHYRGNLVDGQITINNLLAPPSAIHMLSSGKGESTRQMATSFSTETPPTIPVALNDSFSMNEDQYTQASPFAANVLINDKNAAGGTVTLMSTPLLGTATVNTDGTVSYWPNPNANGTDTFTYTVSTADPNIVTNALISNIATVTLTIAPVNDPPVAVNDTYAATVNTFAQLNVMANDTDPDGAVDLFTVTDVTVTQQPAGSLVSATTGAVAGYITFNANAGGTYSFTYNVLDKALQKSIAPATVTVRVAAESLAITRAEYIVSKNRIKVQGSITPAAGQRITVYFIDAAGTVLGTAGSVVEAAGSWTLDTAVARPSGATAVKAVSSNGTAQSRALALK